MPIRIATSSLLCLVLVGACAGREEPAQADPETIARGRYLVTLGGCNDCHTPKILTPTGPVLLANTSGELRKQF